MVVCQQLVKLDLDSVELKVVCCWILARGGCGVNVFEVLFKSLFSKSKLEHLKNEGKKKVHW